MNHNQIKSIVYNLIKKYETRNPVRLAKELDIIIQIGDLKKISGCYLKIHERDFIYINEKLLENEKKYHEVLAHELGHAVLHKEACERGTNTHNGLEDGVKGASMFQQAINYLDNKEYDCNSYYCPCCNRHKACELES